MAHSMTGFASRDFQIERLMVHLEIKSVNSRFFDFNYKSSEEFRLLENTLRERTCSKISRGKIDIRIYIKKHESQFELSLNTKMLELYKTLSNTISNNFSNIKEANFAEILLLPDLLTTTPINNEKVDCQVLVEFDKLLNDFRSNQLVEGQALVKNLNEKINNINKIVNNIKALLPKTINNYHGKLKQKLQDILGEISINDNRFSQEFAYICQKIDIDEEIIRLQSHTKQIKDLLNKTDEVAIGKKADFITQEMQREINTIGAKSISLDISDNVVELKVLIEQMREQIQNIC